MPHSQFFGEHANTIAPSRDHTTAPIFIFSLHPSITSVRRRIPETVERDHLIGEMERDRKPRDTREEKLVVAYYLEGEQSATTLRRLFELVINVDDTSNVHSVIQISSDTIGGKDESNSSVVEISNPYENESFQSELYSMQSGSITIENAFWGELAWMDPSTTSSS